MSCLLIAIKSFWWVSKLEQLSVTIMKLNYHLKETIIWKNWVMHNSDKSNMKFLERRIRINAIQGIFLSRLWDQCDRSFCFSQAIFGYLRLCSLFIITVWILIYGFSSYTTQGSQVCSTNYICWFINNQYPCIPKSDFKFLVTNLKLLIAYYSFSLPSIINSELNEHFTP